MEWVETTAKSVAEAKDKALDQLGVAEDDAEVIVLEEPKAGLFGRVRGEARVRARVRPTQARQKVDRRRKERSGRGDPAEPTGDDGATTEPVKAPAAGNGRSKERPPRPADADAAADKESGVSAAAVGEQAKAFIEELVAAFGLQGETTLVEDGDDLEVTVAGADLGLLVGPKGATLQAVQDLARVASQRRLGDHSTRLRVDVGGYRVRRREALGRFVTQVADDVQRSGTARALEPMSSADRKIVHEALLETTGVTTRSEGEDPDRRVVIEPVVD